jgi:hypothetical protein
MPALAPELGGPNNIWDHDNGCQDAYKRSGGVK